MQLNLKCLEIYFLEVFQSLVGWVGVVKVLNISSTKLIPLSCNSQNRVFHPFLKTSLHRRKKQLVPFAFQGGIIKVLHKLLRSATVLCTIVLLLFPYLPTLTWIGREKNKRPQYSSFHFCSFGRWLSAELRPALTLFYHHAALLFRILIISMKFASPLEFWK